MRRAGTKDWHWNPKIIAVKLAVFFLKVSTALHLVLHKSKIFYLL